MKSVLALLTLLLVGILTASSCDFSTEPPTEQEVINRAQKLDLIVTQTDLALLACPRGTRILAEWREEMQNKYDIDMAFDGYASLESRVRRLLNEGGDTRALWERLDDIDTLTKRIERVCM